MGFNHWTQSVITGQKNITLLAQFCQMLFIDSKSSAMWHTGQLFLLELGQHNHPGGKCHDLLLDSCSASEELHKWGQTHSAFVWPEDQVEAWHELRWVHHCALFLSQTVAKRNLFGFSHRFKHSEEQWPPVVPSQLPSFHFLLVEEVSNESAKWLGNWVVCSLEKRHMKGVSANLFIQQQWHLIPWTVYFPVHVSRWTGKLECCCPHELRDHL